MIDIRKLKELVRLMVNNDLTELDLRDSEEQVTLRRPSVNSTPQVVSAPVAPASVPTAAAPVAAPQSAGGATAVAEPSARTAASDEGMSRIESPMVGTFYISPNPDSPPFVEVGSRVSEDTVVCIIEAMKIFNEIKAECSGTIEKVLVKNAQSVEFGESLFLVRPD